jgi:hypothetical protein
VLAVVSNFSTIEPWTPAGSSRSPCLGDANKFKKLYLISSFVLSPYGFRTESRIDKSVLAKLTNRHAYIDCAGRSNPVSTGPVGQRSGSINRSTANLARVYDYEYAYLDGRGQWVPSLRVFDQVFYGELPEVRLPADLTSGAGSSVRCTSAKAASNNYSERATVVPSPN